MEHRWPDEGQHAAGEAADESHEDGEVRNDDGEHDRHDHNGNTEPEAPNLQLAVQGPDRGKDSIWLSLENFF